MDLGLGPRGDVESLVGRRLQCRSLDVLEDDDRLFARRAVYSYAGELSAPAHGTSASIVEVDEALALKPTLSDIRDLIFYARLVLWMADARGIDSGEIVRRVMSAVAAP